MPEQPPQRRPRRQSHPTSGGIGLEGLLTLLASANAQQLQERVLDGVMKGVEGAEQAFLWLKDNHRRFDLVAARGLDDELVRGLGGIAEASLRSHYGGADWPGEMPSVLLGEPHLLRRLLGERLPPELDGVTPPATVMSLALSVAGEVWAVVQLLLPPSTAPSDKEKRWFAEYLIQVSPVLREFHLRESAERRSLWLAAINTLLRAPRDQAIEVTLQNALEEINRLSGAEGARLIVFEAALHTAAQAGWGAGLPVEAAVSERLGELAKSGEQVSIPRYDLYPSHQPELVEAGLRSLFLLPVQRQTDEMSALLLYSTRRYWQPDSQTQTLLSDMAAAIAVVRREWSLQRELAWAAYTDPLTGLGNRRAFERDLANLSVRPGGRTVVLVLLDLDNFKGLNDTYGHVHADHVLVRLGGALRAKARAGDRAYRLGGDEFALIIEGPQSLNPARTAERYRALLEEIRVSDSEYLQASLGWAVPHDSGDLNHLWREADDAMYRDKAVRRAQAPLFALPQGRPSILSALNTPRARVARRLAYAAGLLPEEIDVLMASCFLLDPGSGQGKTPQLSDSVQRLAKRILSFMEAHWDGSGQPPVGGERIPKAARILQVAGQLVSLLRPEGGPPASLDEALESLEAEAGSRFDPSLVELLVRLKDELGLEGPAT